MAKLGLPRHRYTVAILGWLYVISAVILLIFSLFGTFSEFFFALSLIHLLLGCLSLYALYKQNGMFMKITGIILVFMVIIQLLEIIILLICMFVREAFINAFLKELMDTYYNSVESKEIIDGIQSDFQCCGRQTYSDWESTKPQPESCCKTEKCLSYNTDGCADKLDSVFLYILLGYGLIHIVSTIIHVYAVISAFTLERIYRRGSNQPSVRNNFANI